MAAQDMVTPSENQLFAEGLWKVRHLLPQAWSGILDVLLDLTLFPACRWIAELWRKDIMVRHRQEADVDLPLLAPAYAIDRCLHVMGWTSPSEPSK
jgi:hypothetical protein